MTFLSAHLPFADADVAPHRGARQAEALAALPPAGSHTLVTDTLASPAHFVLYHFVAAAIAAKHKLMQQVLWVDLRGEGKASLESVMKKLGTPVPSSTASFAYIEPSVLEGLTANDRPSLFGETGDLDLKPLYKSIASAINPEDHVAGGTVVVLDGLAELLHMGFQPGAVSRMIRAILALARKCGASLVTTLHADPKSSLSSPETDLLNCLIALGGGGWIRVSSLSSGRSGDVHGEVTSYPLWPAPDSSFPSVPDSQPLQYRLEDRTVKVFPKGTGRGFL